MEKYFLAANSTEGFVSHFADSYNCFDGWRAFIIKGGPGTGKSSFMKKAAARAEDVGIKAVMCYCSSDPDSLDAVIFEKEKIIIADGTSPHTLEPKFPGACEIIINLGDFWDGEKLYLKRNKIIEETFKNKVIHKAAARYLSAAGQIYSDNIKILEPCCDKERAEKFALSLTKRFIPEKKNKKACEWPRFIGGITPKGVVCFTDTVKENYKNKIIIADDYGVAAPIIMAKIRESALEFGYEIKSLKNPFVPSYAYDHILIPELSLAFLTENRYTNFCGDTRRIHARRFFDVSAVIQNREKIRFNKKLFRELISGACELLACAKESHDRLESYYIDAMDFDLLAEKCDKLCNAIFEKKR